MGDRFQCFYFSIGVAFNAELFPSRRQTPGVVQCLYFSVGVAFNAGQLSMPLFFRWDSFLFYKKGAAFNAPIFQLQTPGAAFNAPISQLQTLEAGFSQLEPLSMRGRFQCL